MKKDLEAKQQCIESLETQNITLNKSQNEKDDEIHRQYTRIESMNEECRRNKEEIAKLQELLIRKQDAALSENEKEKNWLDKKTMYELDESDW